MKPFKLSLLLCFVVSIAFAQNDPNKNRFAQLGTELPSPNSYRTASGAPGHDYWQQQADYVMKMRLDDNKTTLHGEEEITYYNNSPEQLSYLWLQLDQNVRAKDSDSHKIRQSTLGDRASSNQISSMEPSFDGGFKIDYVKDANGAALNYLVNKTMMRVDLPKAIGTGERFTFSIKWWYNINNTKVDRGRSGYEPFDEGNNVYCIAQFFPRMCAYNDIEGWQNKQFLGRGEFALVFGDYDVEITVPSDHLVAASGELQNANDVLTAEQKRRWESAKNETVQPVMIVTKEDADKNMKQKARGSQTWHFKADNVRDFAFATSRRFIWDALGVKMEDGRTIMAQSMYVKEGDCLWNKYSTKAVAHTIKWFSHYTFDYPYPVAWSIDGSMGMEYPMICFNYGRCEDDDTYSERMKYGHIGVIIHEVGHNWFPMIVNSDERQWTWMDEGLTTFVQYLTEQQWERNYPSRRGPAHKITGYMGGDKARISPIMSNSESIYQFGSNAYGKPATGLNILRETVMGRELFDFAFKEYSNRWKFKSPYPADFFRTMEDASGVDLDWFWRGWFYSTDHTDMAIKEVKRFALDSKNPSVEKGAQKEKRDRNKGISHMRNKEIKQTYDEQDPTLKDFYSTYDELNVDAIDQKEYKQYLNNLSAADKELLKSGANFYEITVENKGGLIMPIIFEFQFIDGTAEIIRIPPEIWKMDESTITKVFKTDKEIKKIVMDPFLETADVDTSNNNYPPEEEVSKFELYKSSQGRRGGSGGENPMQRAERAKKLKGT